MDNKRTTKIPKGNSFTKLISAEYAIINEDGTIEATTDKATAEKMAKDKKVFIIKTYELKIKHQLKNT